MTRQLEICEDATQVARVAAALIAAAAPRTVALSGGEGPRETYALLHETGILTDTDAWQVDERCVAADAIQSNGRMIAELLGDAPVLHRVATDEAPVEAARIYEESIIATLGAEPVFDLIVLGMGADGHTASLFPDAEEIAERDRVFVATRQPHGGFHRVTLTLPVLNRARAVIFIVSGADKAAAFARIQDGDLLPAGRVLGATWIIDRAVLDGTGPHGPGPQRAGRRRRTDPIEGQEALF